MLSTPASLLVRTGRERLIVRALIAARRWPAPRTARSGERIRR